MKPGKFTFHGFSLDPVDRQLRRGDVPVELNARYFDALTLLVREAGSLVSKDRFHSDIWRGVPVTDEALTQCIRTLRRQLGDQVSVPRFIETVPKHGYRFIAPVTQAASEASSPPPAESRPVAWREVARLGSAGALGGAGAGLVGGLLYGFTTSSPPASAGVGEASGLLVLICLTVIAGLIGGAGVSFGIAAAERARRNALLWTLVGGAGGGLVVGALARLIGLDSFNLLLGTSPGNITGGSEGLLLGAAIALGDWISRRSASGRIVPGAVLGAAAGLVICALGGRMMGGSLDSLARQFPSSRLHMEQIGRLFGENHFGPLSQLATGAIEGALFGAGIVAALAFARRSEVNARATGD